ATVGFLRRQTIFPSRWSPPFESYAMSRQNQMEICLPTGLEETVSHSIVTFLLVMKRLMTDCWSVRRAWQLNCKRFITNRVDIISAGLMMMSLMMSPRLVMKRLQFNCQARRTDQQSVISLFITSKNVMTDGAIETVRGSNPSSAFRLPLTRLEQRGSIPTLLLPSGGVTARHRKGVSAEQLSLSYRINVRAGIYCTPVARDMREITEGLGAVSKTRLPRCGRCDVHCAQLETMQHMAIEDRVLPDSARSSPLPPSVFSHPSPGPHSSPSSAHCTRPLSVLTDFSSSSGGRGHPDLERSTTVTSVSYSNGMDSFNHRPPIHSTESHSPNPLTRITHKHSNSQMNTPTTTPATDSIIQPRSPCNPDNICRLKSANGYCNSSSPSPSVPQQCSVASSTPTMKPTHRGIGVNTTLDTCKGTITEPDLLGPCEPGTTICLNGIVWLETTT
ncbi:hypothetical protein CSKR_201189, partial [Clonorchis sinensis]